MSQGYHPGSYGPGYGQYYGQQGYPGVPQPGFPIMGGQPQYGTIMQPQGVPPPHQYAAVGDHGTMGQWGLPPIAQSYDQHGGDSHGQASVDRSSSSCSKAGDRKSHATDDAHRKQENGYNKSSDKQRSSSSHDDRKSSRGGHPRDDHASHSRNGDGKKSTKQNKDDDREADILARQNIDALLQDEQLKNILFAGISKATAKLEQSLKSTDKKLENYESTDDSTSRHKAQQSVSRERDAVSPPHSNLLDEAQKLRNMLHGGHEKSLWLSERFRDEPKDEYLYRDEEAAALFAALSSKWKEVSSSSSKSLRLPLQSGSVRVENLRVTSRVHSDDDEPYIESRKVILPSKSDVRNVSQSPVFRKSQSPETKVPRKRPASPPLFPVSKERRVFSEKGSINDLQAFLMRSLEENAPEICQVLGLDVDSYYKSPILLNVGGLPVAKRVQSPVMSDHFNRDNVRKSPDRQTLRSPDVRTSRSPGRLLTRSPKKQKSRSPVRQMSWSPGRRTSESTDRQKSRSPDRHVSILPKRRKSVSPGRHTSRSPDRRRSISLERHRSRSPDRRRSRSPDNRRSRSPGRRRSRSPDRRRSRSPGRRRSRSPGRRRSRSPDRRRSRSPGRRRSRSPDRRRSRSPGRRRSKSPDKQRSRSPDRQRSRSPCRRRSRSPGRRRSRTPNKRRSRSLDRRRSKSPDKQRSRSPDRQRSRSPCRRRSRSPDRRRSRSPGSQKSRSTNRQRSRSPAMRRSRSLEHHKPRSPARIKSPLRARPRSPGRHRSITTPFKPTRTRSPDRLKQFAKHKFPVRETEEQLDDYSSKIAFRNDIKTENDILGEFPVDERKTILIKREDPQMASVPCSLSSQEKVYYECYDSGNYWCRHCSFHFSSLEKLLEHNHTDKHLSMIKTLKKPWKSAEEKQPKRKVGSSRSRQIKGAEMMFPLQGFFCSLCLEFLGDMADAANHLKDDQHYDQYMDFVKKNPIYEKTLLLEKTGVHVKMKFSQLIDPEPPLPPEEEYSGRGSKTVGEVEMKMTKEDDNHPLDEFLTIGKDSAQLDQVPLPVVVETEFDFLDILMPEDLSPLLDIPMPEESSPPPEDLETPTEPFLTNLSHTVKSRWELRKEKKSESIVDEKRLMGIDVDDEIEKPMSAVVIIPPSVTQAPLSVVANVQDGMKFNKLEEAVQASITQTNPQPEELKQAQAADSTLLVCYHKLLKAHSPPHSGEMYMKNGLLYRRAGKEGLEHAQLVVPSSYRAQILDMGHNLPFSGHMGINTTTQRISTHFYWPKMNVDIVRYVRSCFHCQREAPKQWITPASLGEIPITGTPFENVAVDIVGPLNRTKRRNRYILTLVDNCSMWAEAVPMPSTDSKHVAEALTGIFTRLGYPLSIIIHDESQFRKKLMEEVLRLFQSQQIHTSPFHPASQGAVERSNYTLISILRKLSYEKPETWDTYVPAASFAYVEVPHDLTGFAPATLLFGRPIKGPLEALLRTWTDDKADETVVTVSTYVAELKQCIQHDWNIGSDNPRKARRKIALYYKNKAKVRELEVGEKVLLLLPASQNKMQISWKGPYEVIEKISHTNYRISIRGKHKSFHINTLRKYNERPTS